MRGLDSTCTSPWPSRKESSAAKLFDWKVRPKKPRPVLPVTSEPFVPGLAVTFVPVEIPLEEAPIAPLPDKVALGAEMLSEKRLATPPNWLQLMRGWYEPVSDTSMICGSSMTGR